METVLLMTGTRAIAVLAHSFITTVCSFVFVWPVITGVATRTVRLESSVLPGNQLGVLCMTFGALQVATMILRLIWQRCMSIVSRGPRVRCMADITFDTGTEVARILACCRYAVVTGRAGPQHLGVVNSENGREHIRRMAVLAYIGRLNVCRVLAGRVRTVVAAKTIARDVHVIEVGRQPAYGAVTIIAVVAAGYMIRCLAGGSNAIVTRPARAQNLGMVNRHHRREDGRGMTVFTNVGCQRMRWVFAGRVRTVVAVDAATRNSRVIECGR